MVITRKLAHKVQNELQAIMGFVEVGVIKIEDGKQEEAYVYFKKAKDTIRNLSLLLNERIKEDHEVTGWRRTNPPPEDKTKK